jgi:hypothetical protein
MKTQSNKPNFATYSPAWKPTPEGKNHFMLVLGQDAQGFESKLECLDAIREHNKNEVARTIKSRTPKQQQEDARAAFA